MNGTHDHGVELPSFTPASRPTGDGSGGGSTKRKGRCPLEYSPADNKTSVENVSVRIRFGQRTAIPAVMI
jgi:hypothetical protein